MSICLSPHLTPFLLLGVQCKLLKLMYKDQIAAVLETTGCTLSKSCAADRLPSNRYQSVHTVSCQM